MHSPRAPSLSRDRLVWLTTLATNRYAREQMGDRRSGERQGLNFDEVKAAREVLRKPVDAAVLGIERKDNSNISHSRWNRAASPNLQSACERYG